MYKIVGPVHNSCEMRVQSVDEMSSLWMKILETQFVHNSHTGGVSKFINDFNMLIDFHRKVSPY